MAISSRRAIYLIFFLSLLTRLYGITLPLTDAGHERQTQVAMIARNLLRDNFAIFHPRVDIFPPGPGYVALEFPLQPALMALGYKFLTQDDRIGRVISVFFSMLSIYFFLALARHFLTERYAIFACAIYALTPMSIYFGRAVFPESLLLCFILASVHYGIYWSKSGQLRAFSLTIIFAALACLMKPPPGMTMLLFFATLCYQRYRFKMFRTAKPYIMVLVILAPVLAWAFWARQLVGPILGWNPYQLSAIARWGIPHAWFDLKFYAFLSVSICSVTLTPLVTILSLFGLLKLNLNRESLLLCAWFIAMLLYVFGTPGAQASHWNYQVPLIPIGALLAGHGLVQLKSHLFFQTFSVKFKERRCLFLLTNFLLALAILCHLWLYMAVFKSVYDINKRIPNAIELGKIVQTNTDPNSIVLLIEPNIVPVPQAYYFDRKTQLLSDLTPNKLDIETVKKWELLGANAIATVVTPYGDGVSELAKKPELVSYINKNYRAIISTPKYQLFVKP